MAKLGARAGLSFAFEHSYVEHGGQERTVTFGADVLQQALDILRELPVPSLYNQESVSAVWLDAVDQLYGFLQSVCHG